jgi:hypothetical protein
MDGYVAGCEGREGAESVEDGGAAFRTTSHDVLKFGVGRHEFLKFRNAIGSADKNAVRDLGTLLEGPERPFHDRTTLEGCGHLIKSHARTASGSNNQTRGGVGGVHG